MSEYSRGLIITPGTDRQLGAYGLFRPAPSQQRVVALPSQGITLKNADPDMLWVSFSALCGSPLGAADYVSLASEFPAWVVDGIPSPAVESAAGSAAAWHRFLEALDILHERDVTPFLIGPGPLDWEAAAPRSAGPPSQGASALVRIADRLALLRRAESDEQLEDEQTSGC